MVAWAELGQLAGWMAADAERHAISVVTAGSPSGVDLTAGQLRSDGARRERDITDIPGAKNVGDVSFTAPDGLREPTT